MVSEKSLGKIKIAISEPCKYYVYSYCKQSNVTIDVLWHFMVFQSFYKQSLLKMPWNVRVHILPYLVIYNINIKHVILVPCRNYTPYSYYESATVAIYVF